MENIDNDKSLNVSDVKILIAISDKDNPSTGRSEIKGVTIKTLVTKTKYSHVKVRGTIKLLIQKGFVAEGLRNGNSKTYYMTDDGIKLLKEYKLKGSV